MKIIEDAREGRGSASAEALSPIVAGLNDETLGDGLKRAAEAVAQHAFYVSALPGASEGGLRDRASVKKYIPIRRGEGFSPHFREAHAASWPTRTFGHSGVAVCV